MHTMDPGNFILSGSFPKDDSPYTPIDADLFPFFGGLHQRQNGH
jgi:hypothetical protein